VKFYDFIDKEPAIGKLVVIEGTERVLADRALEALLDRVLPSDVRELNLARFTADDVADVARVADAVAAMPFLADRRVVVVTDTQTLRADARRELFAVAQAVPEGNTLVLLDLLSPRAKMPHPFGAAAGRAALRVDTTAGEETRARFVQETLARLNAKAEPRVIGELARGEAQLAAVRNDLEKLALAGKEITLKDLAREALTIEDPKIYEYAQALTAGKIADALAIAHEYFANDPRNAGVPLLSALATECGYIWELTRSKGKLPERWRWREPYVRPLAKRIGASRARAAYERAVRGIEAIVTGRAGSDPDDQRALVDRITVELSILSRR
jgi:DNA polymerase III delta subunit